MTDWNSIAEWGWTNDKGEAMETYKRRIRFVGGPWDYTINVYESASEFKLNKITFSTMVPAFFPLNKTKVEYLRIIVWEYKPTEDEPDLWEGTEICDEDEIMKQRQERITQKK